MKTVVVILLFLLVPSLSYVHPSDYTFCLAWERTFDEDPCSLHFADINGDGLSEILYFCYDIMDTTDCTLTALDTFGNPLWVIQPGKSGCSLYFEDTDCDNVQEIYAVIHLTHYLQESSQEKGQRQITCFDGKEIVWAQEFEKTLQWRGSLPEFLFVDSNNDGYTEVMAANYVLDRNGTVLHKYDDDFNIIAASDIDKDSQIELILEKRPDLFRGKKEFSFHYKLIEMDGSTLWEKKWFESVCLSLDAEGNRLFILYRDHISEIDLVTFEEEIKTAGDFSQKGRIISPELHRYDLDHDGEHEYVVYAHYVGEFEDCILVYDKNFNLLWGYTASLIKKSITDIDADGMYEILILQELSPSSFPGYPFYFSVLDHDGNQKWNILFDKCNSGPYVVDTDADGKSELIFGTILENGTTDVAVWEKLNVFKSEPVWKKHLYFFNCEGVLKKQIEVPFPTDEYFHDFDGDGDVDIFLYEDNRGYLYSNSLYKGPLDCKGIPADVDLSERGFRRNTTLNVKAYTELQKLKSLLNIYDMFLFLDENLRVLSGVIVIFSLAFSLFLTVLLKKKESDWSPLCGSKKVALYILLLIVPPVAFVYFLNKLRHKEYRNALGFSITRGQLFIAVVLGVIFLFSSFAFSLFLFLSEAELPDTQTQELVENYFVIAVFLIVITAPIVEEIIFSGHLYPLLRKKLGVTPGIMLTALVFAGLHLEILLIPLFFVHAAIKTYAYERTHCMYIPLIIHFINNSLIVAAIVL